MQERTYSVSELGEEIKAFLGEAFGGVWVAGEINRLSRSRRGHAYFELCEKDTGDGVLGSIDGVIWRSDLQRIERLLASSDQALGEGIEIRCRGTVDFYPPGGRLQLLVRDVDPVFSLGLLARRRRETLAALSAAGLLELNRALPFPPLPLSVAVVTSHGSAAYHDFLTTLRESGYCFRLTVIHSSVQGRQAERQLVSALRTAGGLDVGCVVLVRGGGSRSDLAVFDSQTLAEAIARLPVPLLTGLGHETDESVADLVAHRSFKTPTGAGEFLVRTIAEADRRRVELAHDLARRGRELLRTERERLGRASEGLRRSRHRIDIERARVGEAGRLLSLLGRGRLERAVRELGERRRRLGALSPRLVSRAARERRRTAGRLILSTKRLLSHAGERVDAVGRLSVQLGPRRALERGFSVTRSSEGAVIKDAEAVGPGDVLVTELARGTLTSRVEET